MTGKDIAQAILTAQRIREESFIPSTDPERIRTEDQSYSLSEREAAQRAVRKCNLPEYMIQLIYILNVTAWNDVQDWANEVNEL